MCDTCGGHGPTAHGHSDHADLRVVVAGKGGVGKSTLTALLARSLGQGGERVLAVDADEQRNLGVLLGIDPAALRAHLSLSADAAYVAEKTGSRPGRGGGLLRLNPETSDVVDRCALTGPDEIRLLVMGGVSRAGGGCLCPEHALVSATIADMRQQAYDVVLMDTHAGVEHFGRSLARGFGTALVVVDPTYNAVAVGHETATLARDLGIEHLHLVVNRVRGPQDRDDVTALLASMGAPVFASCTTVPLDASLEGDGLSPSAPPLDGPAGLAVATLGRELLGHSVARHRSVA